jgi:serine/threonine protein kinase
LSTTDEYPIIPSYPRSHCFCVLIFSKPDYLRLLVMSTTLTFSNVSVTVPESRIGQLLAGRLELTGILGVGAYGIVYNAVDIFTCTPYAVKALTKNGLDPRQKQFQQREIALHLKASAHPNIVSLVKIVETSDCIFVVLEYCSEGDLFTNITERGHYVGNDALAKQVFLHLLDAVEHCHSLGIYHRDLKPENVLVCDGGMRVKLADFGLATTDRYTTDFGCGSTFYMSPGLSLPFITILQFQLTVWVISLQSVNSLHLDLRFAMSQLLTMCGLSASSW